MTSLTVDEFQPLVPPFEAAFQSHMAHWRLDGKPRTARRYTTYQNCPLPTPEDRLLFLLVYLKTYPLQVVQGRLFGMGQSKAHQWIHVLLVVLRAGERLDGALVARIRRELARGSASLIPDAVIRVDELPVTHDSKPCEAAARDAVNGLSIVDHPALRNPACLAALAEHPALRERAGVIPGSKPPRISCLYCDPCLITPGLSTAEFM